MRKMLNENQFSILEENEMNGKPTDRYGTFIKLIKNTRDITTNGTKAQ